MSSGAPVDSMLSRALICCFLLALAQGLAAGQVASNSGNSLSRNSADKSRPNDDENIRIGSPEAEMIRKRLLEANKKVFQEHLARAHEAAQLGAALHAGFLQNKSLAREDYKKLERVEKLAKRMREHISDESGPADLDDKPATLDAALIRLDAAALDLEKQVNATPRNVVSAAVLEKASQLEALARFIRARWPLQAQ